MCACLLGMLWTVEGFSTFWSWRVSPFSSGDLASSVFYHDLYCGLPIIFSCFHSGCWYNSPTEHFLLGLFFLGFLSVFGYWGILAPYCLNSVAGKLLFSLFFVFYCRNCTNPYSAAGFSGKLVSKLFSSYLLVFSSGFGLHWLLSAQGFEDYCLFWQWIAFASLKKWICCIKMQIPIRFIPLILLLRIWCT